MGLERLLELPVVRRSPLYEKAGRGKVKCGVCERRCVLEEGERGFCKTRANLGGDLYTLVYGDLSALESRPIEIKPFFHFWPGSSAITISTWSCNFTCPWCQNWHLSRREPDPLRASYTPPEYVVERALERGDEGTCISFNEPLMLFEYSLDLFRLARSRGLYNTYVSNGYMTLSALDMLKEAGLDGLKIDIKGGREEYRRVLRADYGVPWRNAERARKLGIHVEIVCLLVTGVSDREEVVEEIVEEHLRRLGPDVPIHFTRYYPAYTYYEPPTRIEILERAYEIAKKAGVRFPYIGNVPGHPYEHTYCPECGERLIARYGYEIVEYKIVDGKCPKCGEEIPIAGTYVAKRSGWTLS